MLGSVVDNDTIGNAEAWPAIDGMQPGRGLFSRNFHARDRGTRRRNAGSHAVVGRVPRPAVSPQSDFAPFRADTSSRRYTSSGTNVGGFDNEDRI